MPLNRSYPNLTKVEREGGDQFVTSQWGQEITIKPADKLGEICSEKVASQLLIILVETKKLINEGVEKGFIHSADALQLIPFYLKPGHYYGLWKLQKLKES